MASVRICVEGGGAGRGRQLLRVAFQTFLREFAGFRPNVIACGGRHHTLSIFLKNMEDHPDAFVILLVDAERAVVASPQAHLSQPPDNWSMSCVVDDQVHLMVQAVEAWMIADRDALRNYFGQGFNDNPLPSRPPEAIPKDDLKRALDQAGRQTNKHGYDEITDGTKIIERLDPAVVRSKCPSCRRLFDVICDQIGVQRLP